LFVSRFSRAIVWRSERASALSLLQQGGLSSSALLKGFFLERVAARSGVCCGAFLGLAKESNHGGVCGRRGGGGRGVGGDSEAAYRQA